MKVRIWLLLIGLTLALIGTNAMVPTARAAPHFPDRAEANSFEPLTPLPAGQNKNRESEAPASSTTFSASVSATPRACDEKMLKEVLAPASASARTVMIGCHLSLDSSHVVTKRLIIEGVTGVTINCNGATLDGSRGINKKDTTKKDMIEVRSKSYITGKVRKWQRPENILIRNCKVKGSVRLWGMTKNGEGYEYKGKGEVWYQKKCRDQFCRDVIKIKRGKNHFKISSKTKNHVGTVRRNAPKNIVLDNLTITGVGRNPVYFGPGVTYSKLINSEVRGKSTKVGVYLDAESYGNTIKNNYIHVATKNDYWGRGWPLVAIDGSSHNSIMNNRFSSLNHGGIYIYRNCGEGGVIRHSIPSHNTIVNNIFYYNKYTGYKPAVYLGSRDYGFLQETFGHCNDDNGRPFGSSASNKDHAKYNVIMQNQFYKRSIWKTRGSSRHLVEATIDDQIRSKNRRVNSPNYIGFNQMVSAERRRPAGCYVARGYKTNFIFHGQSIDLFKNRKGEPTFYGYKYTCINGNLTKSNSSGQEVSKTSFSCQVRGSNNGCHKFANAPNGQKILGAAAACNLEYGTISVSTVAAVPVNTLKVIRASDPVAAGSCYVGKNRLQNGQNPISEIIGLGRVSVGCKEHDKNGGDCHIKGILYSR